MNLSSKIIQITILQSTFLEETFWSAILWSKTWNPSLVSLLKKPGKITVLRTQIGSNAIWSIKCLQRMKKLYCHLTMSTTTVTMRDAFKICFFTWTSQRTVLTLLLAISTLTFCLPTFSHMAIYFSTLLQRWLIQTISHYGAKLNQSITQINPKHMNLTSITSV